MPTGKGKRKGKGKGPGPSIATESVAGLRPSQEDAVFAEALEDGRTLLAVADGMGGHAAGEVASALALETLVAALEAGESLGRAFRLANERVHEESRKPDMRGMGTTLVAALLEGDTYQVANIGDSRCYLLSEAGIRRLTEDHSFVAEAIRRGQSEEEAKASQWREALTRAVGTARDVEADVFGPFPVVPASALLLCSDGLYKTLPDRDLRDLYLRADAPQAALRLLVSSALERGSDDNITVAVAEFT